MCIFITENFSMNQYNVWNKWGKLKTVMLGQSYTSDFFQDIKNNRIRSALQRIADETQEDLNYYESVLKDFGCHVLRPKIDINDSIMNYIDINGITKFTSGQGVPRSPLQPRDCQLVIGNNLYYTAEDHISIKQSLDTYSKNYTNWADKKYFQEKELGHRSWNLDQWNFIAGVDWGSYYDYKNDLDYFDKLLPSIKKEIISLSNITTPLIPAPSITLVGQDLYIDYDKGKYFFDYQYKNISKKIPNIRINKLHHGGHSDGCFHTLKPGVILSLHEIQAYDTTFPGWDVCYLPDQSWHKVEGFLKLKKQVGGKWWVPGEEENNEFTNFVETWLQDWVGYVEETVFDVNVLVLDEHHVCVNNMNPTVIEFLKKHNMEPVHVPWRHRYFWDGGLHCITLDLEREGVQEDYFPERGNVGVIDYGFD